MIKTVRRTIVTALLLGLAACSDPTPSDMWTSKFQDTNAVKLNTLIEDRTEELDVESVSLTVLSDGTALSFHHGRASETSLMQAASLSKAVAAAGILMLMEREGINIDTDIREQFTSIKIDDIPGGHQPLTVRELLSHTAGATQGGYPGYRRGKDLPSSAEIITDPPSRLVSSVELSLPKGDFRYSGGGYQIAQLLAEDISGQPFAQLMKDILFDPIGMRHSTFEQPIESANIAPLEIVPARSGRRIREGLFHPLKDSWRDYPEQAAAGLWTTSAEYARFLEAVLDAAAGQKGPISQAVANVMLTPVSQTNFGDEDSYGLGVLLKLNDQGQVAQIRHSGLNAGYRSLFAADLQTDRIVVAISNAPGGATLNSEIVDGLIGNTSF